jgi:hypothetical protein
MTPIWSADGKQGSISLTKQPVRVAAGGGDEEGYLIFAHERLIAVLVRLSQQHEEMAGRWYLEIGFGRLEGPRKPTFDRARARIEDVKLLFACLQDYHLSDLPPFMPPAIVTSIPDHNLSNKRSRWIMSRYSSPSRETG